MPSVWFGKKSPFFFILGFYLKAYDGSAFLMAIKEEWFKCLPFFVVNIIEQWKGGEVIDLIHFQPIVLLFYR